MSTPKSKQRQEFGYGIRRMPGGWAAVEYKIVDGRLVSTRPLAEPADYGSAVFYLRQAILKDWTVGNV